MDALPPAFDVSSTVGAIEGSTARFDRSADLLDLAQTRVRPGGGRLGSPPQVGRHISATPVLFDRRRCPSPGSRIAARSGGWNSGEGQGGKALGLGHSATGVEEGGQGSPGALQAPRATQAYLRQHHAVSQRSPALRAAPRRLAERLGVPASLRAVDAPGVRGRSTHPHPRATRAPSATLDGQEAVGR